VRHVLQTFADEGHCAVVQGELIEAATTLLGGCPRKTRPALSAIVAVGEA